MTFLNNQDRHVTLKLRRQFLLSLMAQSFFGISDTYFLVGDVDCRGDEQSLDECPKSFSVGSCTGHNIAGTHCIPMKATHLMSGQDNVIIGLTVTLSVVIFILFLMTVFIFKNRIKGLRTKVCLGS